MAVQAHRGSPDAEAGIHENSLAAFTRAAGLGADGVELDVRLTRDGALAVHHDAMIAGVGAIAELTAAELPGFVPELAAVLGTCADLVVNIELKNLPGEPGYDPEERMAAAVAELVVATDRTETVIVSSFWPETLAAVHRACPQIQTGLLVAPWFDPDACVPAALARACTALHLPIGMAGAELVAAAHDAGLAVAAWTVNGTAQVEAVEAAGVDTVITDDVPGALSALHRT